MRRRVALSTLVLASLVGSVLSANVAQGATSATVRAPRFVYGINTYFTYNCQTDAQITQWANTEMSQYKALHANSLALAFPLYTASLQSNSVNSQTSCADNTKQTPTPEILGTVVKIAHKYGLSILLRPLIDQTNLFSQNPGAWRGQLNPTDVNLWFKNYLTTLRPFLLMSQANHVEHFAIQSELNSLADLPNWRKFAVPASRALYKGDIVFDYSWDTPTAKTPPPGTSLAIDTYPKVTAPITATVKRLLAQWNHLLATRSYYKIPTISRVSIDEIGIAAQDGAYAQPYKGALTPPSSYPFNQAIQVNWFSTACSFMKQHKMKGIYFWGPWLSSNSGAMLTAPNPAKPSNIQPQAQAAVRHCFT